MYRNFPAYTSKLALGNYYGKYLTKSIKEFQKRTGLVSDGCIGPITLAKLKIYGFVE
jgi:murein L,D-transpeptidase YcbB/YkuD